MAGSGEVHDSGAQGKASVEIVILPLEIGVLLLGDSFHHEVGLDDNVENIMRGIFEQQYLERRKRLLLSDDSLIINAHIPVHVSFC